MASTHKPFREILGPDSNFEFVEKRRTWALVSTILCIACVAMLFVNKNTRGDYLNWTIDFKGGTELIFAFENKDGTPHQVEAGVIRKALKDAGKTGFAVSDFKWSVDQGDGTETEAAGMLIRTPEYGAVAKAEQERLSAEYIKAFPEAGILKTTWSGDRMFVRSTKPVDWAAASEFFKANSQTLKEWSTENRDNFAEPVEGTGEYNSHLAVRGLDAQYQQLIGAAVGEGVVVKIQNVYGVGARAGSKLRNDGIKSLFYVVALIMLYLAFRFDIRYAPGAVVALVHDSILVVGVFAVSWQEVSLTTVAALLTVIGYSVNDTVVIFDRIRENVVRLKDKKFARVINISLNETMARTLLTSITLFVVTLMMNILGTGLVRNFAFAMNVGVIVGVYSSIFVASPVALAIHNRWFAGPAPAKK